MEVQIQKIRENAVLPRYGTPLSAGADLYAVTDTPITIAPAETRLIATGLAMAIPAGYVGLIYARSGLATKQGLAPANKVGVIDADYRGEVMVALHNHGTEPRTVQGGDRIAQLVIAPVMQACFCEADSLDETERGGGGFGSTGTN